MEVRVFLSYVDTPAINELLNRSDVDFHSEAAKLAFKVDEDHARFKEYRQAAKAITFGTIYGIGNKKLAQQINTTPQEAGAYKKSYFEGMKGAKQFIEDVSKKIFYTSSTKVGGDGRTGFVRNKYGRVYQLNRDFAYKGVNYLVQGTSADLLSERMVEVDKYLDNKKSNLLLQVHDEIICEIHESELDDVPHKIKELLMTNTLDIPLEVDMELLNPSWATKADLHAPTKQVQDDWIDWDSVPENNI